MGVTLEGTRLWQAQEDKSQSQGDVRIDSIYGDDSDETLLTGLESEETLSYNGIATGNRISQQSGYSNDPNTALAEWVAEVEAYINGTQGTGLSLTDDERGDTKNVVAESFGWLREQGDKYQVSWDMTFIWAEGMMADVDSVIDSVNPTTTWSLDGTTLPPPRSYRQTKRQELEPTPVALADPGNNLVKANSGATRRILIQGQVTDTEGLNSFDDTMQALIGQDNIVEFKSAFPGRTKDVMVRNYESIREAGRTRLGEYTLELIEGQN